MLNQASVSLAAFRAPPHGRHAARDVAFRRRPRVADGRADQLVARPHGADAPVKIEETHIYTVDNGVVVRVREFRTKTEALAVLGLSEQDVRDETA